MNIFRKVAPAAALLAMIVIVPAPAAQSMTLKNSSVSTVVKKPVAPCKNKIVQWMYAAGFRGKSLRIGWAIIKRESGGNPYNVTNGADYGLWQINRPTHPGYSRSQLLDPVSNSKIAFKLSKGGKNWKPWGIGVTKSGKPYMDSSDYDGIWSQWQKDNWIWIPFRKYYRQYPC